MTVATFAAAAGAASNRGSEIGMEAGVDYDANSAGAPPATVTLTMLSTGDMTVAYVPVGVSTPGGHPIATEWLKQQGAGNGDDWEVRPVVLSGGFTSGSTAFQRLNTNRVWTVSRVTTGGNETVNVDWEFRLFGTSQVLRVVRDITLTGTVL